MVVQRLKVGGAGQHLDDAGAKHHTEGGRDDAQHDDAPQIAEQGFLFQGFQHFVYPILFVRIYNKYTGLFIYCQPVTHVCAKKFNSQMQQLLLIFLYILSHHNKAVNTHSFVGSLL